MVFRRNFYPSFIAILLSLHGCGNLSSIESDSKEGNGLSSAEDTKAYIVKKTKELMANNPNIGMITAVHLSNGTSFYISSSDIDKKSEPIDKNTLFGIGSISKGFLADITEACINDKTLSWDTTIGETFDTHKTISLDAQNVTILDLARHTSGMPRQPIDIASLNHITLYLFNGDNIYSHFNKNYYADYLNNYQKNEAMAFQYSNIGYGILGIILEEKTQKPLSQLLSEKITIPLGLNDTSYREPRTDDNHTEGHAGDQPYFIKRGTQLTNWHFNQEAIGIGGIYSSVEDLLTYTKSKYTQHNYLYNQNLLFTPKNSAESHAPAWTIDTSGNTKIAYQVGVISGYSAYIGLDLESGNAIVVLKNRFLWTEEIGHSALKKLAKSQFISKAGKT